MEGGKGGRRVMMMKEGVKEERIVKKGEKWEGR